MPELRWYVDVADPEVGAAVSTLRRRLHEAGWPDGGEARRAPAAGECAVVYADRPLPEPLVAALLSADGVVVLAGPTLERADPERRWAEAAGVWPGEATPEHELRIRPGPDAPAAAARITDHAHTGAAHLGEHVHVADRLLCVEKTADDVEALFVTQAGLGVHPVVSYRPATKVLVSTLGSRSRAAGTKQGTRLLLLALGHAFGLPEPDPVRVGLLGYGATGHEHSRAVRAVDGLELAAVCDTASERLRAAVDLAPGVRTFPDAAELLDDDGVDLVVISTPPNTHAQWALRAIAAGKHVVVEKPFAIEPADADAVMAAATASGRLAVVYQNRRFDPDYLALRRLVTGGAVGDVFHVEAFVGGYGHPCNLWHSDEAVSGGAIYDWGAHVLDQVLDLMPGEVEHVTATTHKRRWFDVTNADHSRVTLRFVDGSEAEFVHSDLAAALKPRWYVLGTDGAVVGHWRAERVVARSDIGTLIEDVLAPGDSPSRLELHAPDGSVTQVAVGPAPPYPFHTELADHLRLGLPMTVDARQSRRVLGVMAAATESAADGGRPVPPR